MVNPRVDRLEKRCPKCDSHLMVREGRNGEFLACPRFPACKHTEPLPDGEFESRKLGNPYCKKCNYTGLLPFIKDGRRIDNAFLHCECHEVNQPDHYTPVRPEDYDYPMSWDSWRSICQLNGWPVPTSERPEPSQEEPEGEGAQQLRGEVKDLRRQLQASRQQVTKRTQTSGNTLDLGE